MEEIYKIILQSSLTIIGAVIIFLIIWVLKEFYLSIYLKFKKELIEVDTILNLYSNIFTNQFSLDQISGQFAKKVFDSQEILRKKWAALLSHYNYIKRKKAFGLIIKKTIPTKNEMDKLTENLIYIYNSNIIMNDIQERALPNQNLCLERHNKIKEITKIISKY